MLYISKIEKFNTNSIIFTYDNNATILLPILDIYSKYNNYYKDRPNKEILFRKIHTYLILNNIIKNNIIDLGSWIGDNSLPWAKNISGIVYAIDPSVENINYINELCKLNNVTNVVTINKAISDKNEIISTNDDLFHASFVFDPEWNNKSVNDGKNKLNAYSLDYLYDTKEIDNIGYIHLDVEGMEYKVILGADNIIKKFKPVITFEQHLNIDDYIGLINHINNYNYTTYKISEDLHHGRDDCTNFISFPKELITPDFINNINNNLNEIALILI